ncbi:hypothetical protein ACFOHW_11855 [Paenibacillus abyssi]
MALIETENRDHLVGQEILGNDEGQQSAGNRADMRPFTREREARSMG